MMTTVGMEIISLKDAKARGLNRYFTGKPCKNSHLCERFTRSCICIKCKIDDAKKSYKRNKNRILVKNKNYREKNKEKISTSQKKSRENNKELFSIYSKRYYIKTPEKTAERCKRYRNKIRLDKEYERFIKQLNTEEAQGRQDDQA